MAPPLPCRVRAVVSRPPDDEPNTRDSLAAGLHLLDRRGFLGHMATDLAGIALGDSERGVRFVTLLNGAFAMGEGAQNRDGHRRIKFDHERHGPILDLLGLDHTRLTDAHNGCNRRHTTSTAASFATCWREGPQGGRRGACGKSARPRTMGEWHPGRCGTGPMDRAGRGRAR